MHIPSVSASSLSQESTLGVDTSFSESIFPKTVDERIQREFLRLHSPSCKVAEETSTFFCYWNQLGTEINKKKKVFLTCLNISAGKKLWEGKSSESTLSLFENTESSELRRVLSLPFCMDQAIWLRQSGSALMHRAP